MTIRKDFKWEDAYAVTVPLVNAEGLLQWAFNPLLPIEIRFYSYDPTKDFRVCRHDYFEIFYLYSGELIFHINDKRFPMTKGDLMIISSTNYHTVTAPANALSSTAYGVHLYFMPEIIRGNDKTGEDIEYLTPFMQQDPSFPHLVTSETGIPKQIFSFIQMMRSHMPPATGRARLTIKTYLKMILITLVNHYAGFEEVEYMFDRRHRLIARLRPLFSFLDEHYSEHISLEDAARVVNMSKSHFLHLMKRVTGLSFVAYLNQFRISKAQALLATTDKSIGEVAQEVGFGDHSYFTHVFRKLLGTTPAEYRVHLDVEAGRDGNVLSAPLHEDEPRGDGKW